MSNPSNHFFFFAHRSGLSAVLVSLLLAGCGGTSDDNAKSVADAGSNGTVARSGDVEKPNAEKNAGAASDANLNPKDGPSADNADSADVKPVNDATPVADGGTDPKNAAAPEDDPALQERKVILAKLKKLDAKVSELYDGEKILGVDFSHCDVVDDDLRLLAPLTELRTLNLHENTKITDVGLAHISRLVNLTSLNLSVTPITDKGMVHLKDLVNLKSLNLSVTFVTNAGLDSLTGMEDLRSLYLFNTEITDDGVAKLAGKTSLRKLCLDGEKLTNASLTHLESMDRLEELCIHGTLFNDDAIPQLRKLESLTLLRLGEGTGVTAVGERKLKRALPRLTIVHEGEE